MLIADENNIEFFIFYRLSTNDNFRPLNNNLQRRFYFFIKHRIVFRTIIYKLGVDLKQLIYLTP